MTTATTVRQLIEELVKFNMDARLEPHVEVGGNPATECQIVVDQTEIKTLKKKIEDITAIIDA